MKYDDRIASHSVIAKTTGRNIKHRYFLIIPNFLILISWLKSIYCSRYFSVKYFCRTKFCWSFWNSTALSSQKKIYGFYPLSIGTPWTRGHLRTSFPQWGHGHYQVAFELFKPPSTYSIAIIIYYLFFNSKTWISKYIPYYRE